MSEVQIKFYNIDPLVFIENSKGDKIVKEDFQTYLIHPTPHKIDILENKNQIMCYFFCDKCNYNYDIKNKILKIEYEIKNSKLLVLEITSHSQNVIQDIIDNINDRKLFLKYKGPLSYNPASTLRTSLLSTESPEENYRGFINVLVIVLIVNHIISIYNSIKEYGIALEYIPNPIEFFRSPTSYAFYCIYLHFIIYIIIAFGVQYLKFAGKLQQNINFCINFINISCVFIMSLVFVRLYDLGPLPSLILIMTSLILGLKIISYVHVMRNVYFLTQRIQNLEKEKKPPQDFILENEISSYNFEILRKHCDNKKKLVSFKGLMYFIVAPTLCFQLIYPKTPKIRVVWLIKRIIEFIVTFIFITYLWFQHVTPVLKEQYIHIHKEKLTLGLILNVMLKLSIPNMYIWVAGFYLFFQVSLNIVSELLRYGDRNFYQAWWNCRDLEEYWKLWNLPVHNWCVRHVYNPLLKKGASKLLASLIVFFVSAFFHEWIVSGSLGLLSYHAFIGMLLQMPTIVIQKKLNKILKLENSQLGNVFFWLIFCFIGQPLAIFLYYDLYMSKLDGLLK